MEATRVKIGLRSIVAILFDHISGVNDQNDQEAQKNAILKLYLDDDGNICLPASNLKASTREASSEVGNKMGSKQRRNAIRAGLFFMPDMIPLGKKEPDGIHAEPVTRKGTGGKVTRVISYRPFLKAWECEVEAILYGITPENLKQYMEMAGLRYGLCGHRPEWGRFEVTKFEVVEN
jgi:hypothetical protein